MRDFGISYIRGYVIDAEFLLSIWAIFLLRLCSNPILRNVLPKFVNVDNKKCERLFYEKWVYAFEIFYFIMDSFVLNQIKFWLSECMLIKSQTNMWFQNFVPQLRISVAKGNLFIKRNINSLHIFRFLQ